ncbi:MAG: ParB/RepB/Spo0J family partition protein [Candidatus Velthaea sp.]
MAAPKRGLGRGLGALLGDAPTTDVTTPAIARGLPQIALSRITPNPNQPRKNFAADALDELRASIAEFGVLVPIIVRPSGDKYELIAGERRWRAATAAQLETIPAIIRQADERESLEVAIIENLQRENLDPLEEAMGFAHLIEAYGFTQERVAQRLGRSRPSIANALRLLTLPDSVKALVRSGALTAGHAKAVLALPPQRREAMAQRIAADGLTVRQVEAFAQSSAPEKIKRAAPPRTNDGDELLERLRYRFATQVTLAARERGGAIEIRYADDGDLMRIADLLLGENTAS